MIEQVSIIQTRVRMPAISPKWKRFDSDEVAAHRLADQLGEPRQRNPPLGAPEKKDERTRVLERRVAIDELRAIVAKFHAKTATEDELFRFCRAAIGIFTADELRRLASGWADHLEESIAPKKHEEET